MPNTKTYLDYAATTPVDPRVVEAMLPYFHENFGNPSSVHGFGQKAEAARDKARETIAQALNCQPKEVIITSCGSESDNLALRGAALAMREKTGANWILTTRIEHHAVSYTAAQLEKHYGFQVEWLETDEYGIVHPETGEWDGGLTVYVYGGGIREDKIAAGLRAASIGIRHFHVVGAFPEAGE